LVVDFGRAAGRPAEPSIRLLNGDQFVGKISFPGGRRAQIGSGWGTMAIPFGWCSAIRLAEKTPLPTPGAHAEILLPNGDRVPGEISDIKENKVLLRVNDVPATLDLARVKAISFARSEPPAEAGSGLQVALDLGGRERLTARWVAIADENLKLQP